MTVIMDSSPSSGKKLLFKRTASTKSLAIASSSLDLFLRPTVSPTNKRRKTKDGSQQSLNRSTEDDLSIDTCLIKTTPPSRKLTPHNCSQTTRIDQIPREVNIRVSCSPETEPEKSPDISETPSTQPPNTSSLPESHSASNSTDQLQQCVPEVLQVPIDVTDSQNAQELEIMESGSEDVLSEAVIRPEADFSEKDPDFQKYIDQARERKKASDSKLRSKASPTSPVFETTILDSTVTTRKAIQVAVISRVPGAEQDKNQVTRFKIYIDDELRILRDTWAKIQEAKCNMSFDSDILLTWRGNMLYSTTTISSLGILCHSEFVFHPKHEDALEGFSRDRKAVVLEAWTRASYEQGLQKGSITESSGIGSQSEIKQDSPSTLQETPQPCKVAKLRLTLQSKCRDPIKLSGDSQTTIGVLIDAYCHQLDLNPKDRSAIRISFDGELLDSALTLGETEIDDLDILEVHV